MAPTNSYSLDQGQRHTEHATQYTHNPEAFFDLHFTPAEKLEVIMKWRHFEDASPFAIDTFCPLKVRNLHNHADSFGHKDKAHNGQQQPLSCHYSNVAKCCAKSQTACVAHKHLRWMGVIPEKSQERTDN